MEATLQNHFLSRIFSRTLPKPNNQQNDPTHFIFAMKNPFKPIFISPKTITFNSRFQDPKFGHATANFAMATENKNRQIESTVIGKQAEEESKKKTAPPPPPPPEKPEPGDCCGGGCVRCVWDVYYEDLEEYDKLYKSDSSKA
ncbi:hypothetical protein SADUNF_Sadunf07G0015000 [Salix dunnii]|uniref:Oxidoreductase-like domain-containing protein n=1 Tax=Salix dunnii TaxID=1413687 RepID=A0A835MYL7_9ROSI|nr:hypothetical protein SADUNF_Sadunf07G0015000 [Salix dunnii]